MKVLSGEANREAEQAAGKKPNKGAGQTKFQLQPDLPALSLFRYKASLQNF